MPRYKKARKAYKKPLYVALVTMLMLAGLWLGYRSIHSRKSEAPAVAPSNAVKIDLSPASDEEKQDSNLHKDDVSSPQPASQNPNAKKSVTPVIVDAGQYVNIEVRSFVPSVVESGGKCTVTFSKGSLNVTRTVDGIQDATTTRCTNLVVDRSAFSQTGTWSVVVSYSSNATEGSSPAKTFEVH